MGLQLHPVFQVCLGSLGFSLANPDAVQVALQLGFGLAGCIKQSSADINKACAENPADHVGLRKSHFITCRGAINLIKSPTPIAQTLNLNHIAA